MVDKFTALTIAVDALGNRLDKLTDTIQDSIKFSDESQKISLGLGLTFKNASTLLKPSIDNLRGSFEDKFNTGVLALIEGLQGNIAGMALLVNQQRLTGGNFQNTFKVQAALVSVLNLGNERTNQLSINLLKTANLYQIQTDKLISTIASLENTFPIQELVGFDEKFIGAIGELQGLVGPQNSKALQSFLQLFLDPSIEAYETLSKLGLQTFRDQIPLLSSQKEITNGFIDALNAASNTIRANIGGGGSFLRVGQILDIFGGNAAAITTLSNNLNRRLLNADKDIVDFGQTLTNLKNEIFAPFVELFNTKIYPGLIEGASAFINVTSKFSSGIVKFIDNLGGVENAIRSIVQGTTRLVSDLLDGASLIKQTFNAIKEGYKIPTTFVGLPNINKLISDMAMRSKREDFLGQRLFSDMLREMEDGSFWTKKSEAHLRSIDEKTPDLNTGSNFLNETAIMLSESIESILGIKKDNGIVYLKDISDTMKDLLDTQIQANSKGDPIAPVGLGV